MDTHTRYAEEKSYSKPRGRNRAKMTMNVPNWLAKRVKPRIVRILLLLMVVATLVLISSKYAPEYDSPAIAATQPLNPAQVRAMIQEISKSDMSALETCMSKHTSMNNFIMQIIASNLGKDTTSATAIAQTVVDRAVGKLPNAEENERSIKHAQEIVEKVDQDIARRQSEIDAANALKKVSTVAQPPPPPPLINITIADVPVIVEPHVAPNQPATIPTKESVPAQPATIPTKESVPAQPASIPTKPNAFMFVPPVHVESNPNVKSYGDSTFDYLSRERSNFEPIHDAMAPRTITLKRRRGLLAIPVSIKSQVKIIPILSIFLEAKFDIMLFHYDLSDWSKVPNYDKFISVRVPNQTKFWFAKRFLPPSMVENYDYLFLWDDDIGLKNGWDPLKFVSILQTYNIHAAQPALDKGTRRNYPQFDTVRFHTEVVKANSPGRFADFIEVMFPVFSREAWQNCIWETIPFDGRSFWGIDNAWYPHCASMGYCRFAVIDVMPVDHLDMRSLYQPQRNNKREFSHYLRLYKQMCTVKPSSVNNAKSMFRIFLICNFLSKRPLGSSFKTLANIDPLVHNRTSTCAEPILWPGIVNSPWAGSEQSKALYWNGT